MKNEIKNLMKIGLSEDLAILAAGVKYGNEDAVNEVLYEKNTEQEELRDALKYLKPFAPMALCDEAARCIVPESTENLFVEIDPITQIAKPVEVPSMPGVEVFIEEIDHALEEQTSEILEKIVEAPFEVEPAPVTIGKPPITKWSHFKQ